MVISSHSTRSPRNLAGHFSFVVSLRSLCYVQRDLTKHTKYRIIGEFPTDAFTHYCPGSRVYVPAQDDTNRESILPFRPSRQTRTQTTPTNRKEERP